jgi:hypothetical protein
VYSSFNGTRIATAQFNYLWDKTWKSHCNPQNNYLRSAMKKFGHDYRMGFLKRAKYLISAKMQ